MFEPVQANNNIRIIANKGYIRNELNVSLAKEKEILLLSLKRKNSKTPLEKQLRSALSKVRRRVETSFSQDEQFNINRVLAKSKWGLMLRITLKILTHNLSFVLNTITENTIHIAQIKPSYIWLKLVEFYTRIFCAFLSSIFLNIKTSTMR